MNMSIINRAMKKFLLIICLVLPFLSSCKVDTYDSPSETLTGKLVCPDGSPLITEQPNGFKIRLNEVVNGNIANIPQDFWGKADGTFNNTKIFKGTYVVQPIEGAFFPVDPVEIEISGKTELTFEVTPYLTITADIRTSGPDVIAKYKITKAPNAGKITYARLLVSKWNPNVGMNRMDYETVRDFSSIDDSEIVKKSYTDSVLDCLKAGVTYYVRIAVLASNASGRYNLSEVVKLEM